MKVYRDKETGLIYATSRAGRTGFMAFLVVCLIVGAIGSVTASMNLEEMLSGPSPVATPVVMMACSLPQALLGASMRYLRKLYLLVFNIEERTDMTSDELRELRFATYLYFYTRPLLVSVATYFLMLALVVGAFSVFMSIGAISRSGWWVVMAISFFVGASGGYPLDRVFEMGASLVRGLFEDR